MRLGEYRKAETALRKAREIDPDFWEARFNLAEVPFLTQDWTEARRRFTALAAEPNDHLDGATSDLIQFKILLTLLLEGKRRWPRRSWRKSRLRRKVRLFFMRKPRSPCGTRIDRKRNRGWRRRRRNFRRNRTSFLRSRFTKWAGCRNRRTRPLWRSRSPRRPNAWRARRRIWPGRSGLIAGAISRSVAVARSSRCDGAEPGGHL